MNESPLNSYLEEDDIIDSNFNNVVIECNLLVLLTKEQKSIINKPISYSKMSNSKFYMIYWRKSRALSW